MEKYYKIVDGVDQDGNPTTFKVEIPQSETDKIRAFNIVNNKSVDLSLLKRCNNVDQYNSQTYSPKITSGEFSFLKGVFAKC